jgi:hypothetical protein
MRRFVGPVAVMSLLALGGCAPVVFAGSGVRVGVAPYEGAQLQSAACVMPGVSSQWAALPGAARGASAFGIVNYFAQTQARYSLGAAQMQRNPESWKRLASGEC